MIIADREFLAGIDEKAQKLKKEILESKTEVSWAGKTYYVSNKGDDGNDGLSPENAINSLERINSLPLESGDAVLFERGGLWRGGLAITAGGLTFSAYGEGKKPRIYGSPKNYSVPSEWEQTEIPNVWKYKYAPDIDIGHIVFNGGQVHAVKKIRGHYGFGDTVQELKNDLEFWCDTNDRNMLYIYSEENPALRFYEIEMHRRISCVAVRTNEGCTIDNLCIMYAGVHGISCGKITGLHITNCEFGYIGGGIHHPGKEKLVRLGNAVEVSGACTDYVIDKCYIHDCYDAGVTHQKKGKYPIPLIMEDITYSNNLIKRCVYSIEYFCEQKGDFEDECIMRNVVMRGNICRYAGGFGWQRPDRVARHIQGGWLNWERKYPAENFVIENNIFDRSKDTLVSISSTDKKHLPVMRGNTYIQYADAKFGLCDVPYDHYEMFDENVEKYIHEHCGDTTAVVAVVPENDGLCEMLPNKETLYPTPEGFVL